LFGQESFLTNTFIIGQNQYQRFHVSKKSVFWRIHRPKPWLSLGGQRPDDIKVALDSNRRLLCGPPGSTAYFAQDIAKLLPPSTDEGVGKGTENLNSSHMEHPHKEEPTASLKRRKCTKESDSHSNSSFIHQLVDPIDDLSTSQPIFNKPLNFDDIANETSNNLLELHEHDISEEYSNNPTCFAIPEDALRVQANPKWSDR
jgi:hypothetical protein